MNAREQRGLVIAATCKLEQKGRVWLVPSQSGNGRYGVVLSPEPKCTCPDHLEGGFKCKHIFAAEYVVRREHNADGSTTVTETLTVTETVQTERKTYKQDWPNY